MPSQLALLAPNSKGNASQWITVCACPKTKHSMNLLRPYASRLAGKLNWGGVALAMMVATLCAQDACAQQHNHAALNSFGRFFGIGWSHGYQSCSADGRFQHVKDQHPASMYPSSGMLYPYSPNYSATPVSYGQPVHHGGNVHGAPMYPTPAPPMHQVSPGYVQPNQGNVLHQPRQNNQNIQPVQPPKPVEPPPAWLKPYLNKDGEVIDSPSQPQSTLDSLEEVVPREGSPSDKAIPKPVTDDDDLLIPQTKLTPMQRYHQAQQLRMTNR